MTAKKSLQERLVELRRMLNLHMLNMTEIAPNAIAVQGNEPTLINSFEKTYFDVYFDLDFWERGTFVLPGKATTDILEPYRIGVVTSCYFSRSGSPRPQNITELVVCMRRLDILRRAKLDSDWYDYDKLRPLNVPLDLRAS